MRLSVKLIGVMICSLLLTALPGGGSSVARASQTESQAGSVFIAAFSPGQPNCATCEFVEIMNTSDADIDVTNWSLRYSSASSDTPKVLGTFSTKGAVHLLLPPGAREGVFGDGQLRPGAMTFTAAMSATAGTLWLVDAQGDEVDMVGWGTTKNFRGSPAPVNKNGWYVRSSFTGNNAKDFPAFDGTTYSLTYGSLQEVEDVCSNIAGLQVEPPAGMIRDASGTCADVDQCSNMPGIQETVPPGYVRQNDDCHPRALPQLRINEVLANPQGVDTGIEYIELYNPTTAPAQLSDYVLVVNGKIFSLPHMELAPGMFFVTTSITLLNSGGTITLRDGLTETLISTTDYPLAKDDVAWAYRDAMKSWDTTTIATPGATNLFPVPEQNSTADPSTQVPCRADQFRNPETNRCKKLPVVAALAPCPVGKARNPATNRCRNLTSAQATLKACRSDQYRNPATNRCRNLTSTGSSLKPCRADQYRNPATNRCRNLASAASTLKPCKADQYRNPETNRCRKIGSTAGSLKPCKAGQERNPATNRCRKARSASVVGTSDFPVTQMAASSQTKLGWWAGGGLGVAGSAVVGWSRRDQFARLFRRLFIKGGP